MSQYGFPDLESPVSGTELINTHLEPALAAILSSHSGSSRPSYVTSGMMWIDTTTNPWILNVYDGNDDIPIGTINTTTNQFIPSNQFRWGGTSGGTSNVQTLTPSPALGTLSAGVAYEFIVGTPNTTAGPTLNISGTGAKTVKYYTSTGKVNVPIGALLGLVRVVYDGTDYIMLNVRPYNQGTAIATASTINLDNALGDYIHLTGTTTVTAITLAQGQERTCIADGVFTLTNGASLILPSGANIDTAAGDAFVVRGEASGVIRIVAYSRADGSGLVSAGLFSESYQSSDISYTGGGQTIMAHGLSGTPKIVQSYLRCKSASAGYSVGDIFMFDGHSSGANNSTGCSITIDSTNITFRWTSNTFMVSSKSNGGWSDASTSAFDIFFVAYY